jgi:transcriptional regulator with XRE-family HTH domain
MLTIPETLAERLTLVRHMRDMTLTDLARATGMHRNYLYMLEAGKSSPTVEKLRLLAGALDVSCAQLLGEADLFEDVKHE